MNAKEARDFLLDMVSVLEDMGKSGSYIAKAGPLIENAKFMIFKANTN
jgi:hypothetical protein